MGGGGGVRSMETLRGEAIGVCQGTLALCGAPPDLFCRGGCGCGVGVGVIWYQPRF